MKIYASISEKIASKLYGVLALKHFSIGMLWAKTALFLIMIW
jgi:hypothetical protein